MAATHKKPSTRIPARLRASCSAFVHREWKASKTDLPLKAWARVQASSASPDHQRFVDWFFNKRANARKPELCIGRTRAKKGAKGEAKKS